MTRRLTVIGDHGMGKSTMLMKLAVEWGEAGEVVLYEAASPGAARESYNMFVASHARFGWPDSHVEQVREGSMEVIFDGGGLVYFEWPGRYQPRQGPVGVHLLDQSTGDSRDDAKVVVRAVLA
ncbi:MULTISPECIES: hypothetical protein [Mycobacteroides]|jgi:KaiC/GvpD/RAD55 family RecA-like ATPase|uniref:hypothetical protein n=1 Tax=Mycobacteroides TaxID=670516 RepID=UPI000927E8E1|nr:MULTISPECIES: hypothetical protein [Mycobacteroides]MBV6360505.1 hypothetical protein [Mycobacteroides chelonae]SHW95025.1 Uncharacterised protein [Mycobacteroides abscessus subsp. abscessus]SKL77947.1 Uncharacterised protein [Mycobacteroides abscessus subsp. abscessus]SKM54792.1 Uncharacterised protein [Mycobacteroides abscessus subsp. abscessus]SLK35898.1 Uncharacterised protein [Mycobacteroides abscessus subsp. abscessus]